MGAAELRPAWTDTLSAQGTSACNSKAGCAFPVCPALTANYKPLRQPLSRTVVDGQTPEGALPAGDEAHEAARDALALRLSRNG